MGECSLLGSILIKAKYVEVSIFFLSFLYFISITYVMSRDEVARRGHVNANSYGFLLNEGLVLSNLVIKMSSLIYVGRSNVKD